MCRIERSACARLRPLDARSSPPVGVHVSPLTGWRGVDTASHRARQAPRLSCRGSCGRHVEASPDVEPSPWDGSFLADTKRSSPGATLFRWGPGSPSSPQDKRPVTACGSTLPRGHEMAATTHRTDTWSSPARPREHVPTGTGFLHAETRWPTAGGGEGAGPSGRPRGTGAPDWRAPTPAVLESATEVTRRGKHVAR